ncbi:MAG: cyclase family protein [Phycisphaerae bacterium]|jgi:arylformamidase|nr:cyclase family protein [Phycisphaerae bacterium]MDP7288266.1 cyclase family protein [Phycisphaerae bacterium]
MKTIYDISTPLGESTPVYPGDPPVRIDRLSDVSRGDQFTLSEITSTLHAGTHIDAPAHYIPNAVTADQTPLDILIGDATLADIADAGAITADSLARLAIAPGTTRLLLRTPDSPQETALSQCGAQWLVAAGVKLVGIDRLSIGLAGQEAQTHRTLLASGVVIAESLNLTDVPPGEYQLICLPLRITAEAAPARAILIDNQ